MPSGPSGARGRRTHGRGVSDERSGENLDIGRQSGRAAAIQKEVLRMRGITNKLTRITRYETRDYLSGRIVELDRSASAANADSTGPGGKA